MGPPQTAEYVGVPELTLTAWRAKGAGPPVYKVGRHVKSTPGFSSGGGHGLPLPKKSNALGRGRPTRKGETSVSAA